MADTGSSAGLGTAEVVEKKAPAKKKEEAVAKKEVLITPDFDDMDVLELTQKTDISLVFDPEDFPRLPSEVVSEFDYETKLRYFQAKKEADIIDRGNPITKIERTDPFGNAIERRLKIRERKGWHTTWLAPESVDGAKDVGYKNVRKQNKDKPEEKAGEETGEIIKLSVNGKAELYAMEVPEDLYQKHLKAISRMGLSRARTTKEDVQKAVEHHNRQARRKSQRVQVVEDSSEEGWSSV